jgi:diguanylate cyclase (GGDEF)-like protein
MIEETKLGALTESAGFSLFQNSPDYVVVLEPDWSIAYANPSFQERFCPNGLDSSAKLPMFLDTPSTIRIREMQPQLFSEASNVDLNHITPESHTVVVRDCFFPLPPIEGRQLLAGVGRDRAGDLSTLLEVIQLNLELGRREQELKEANARLELLSLTDQLTELYNRHYFFQVAQHFWEEARRYRLPLTLMMMDLDDFKHVNDTHGHMFGDHVLQHAAARLKSNTRKSDILARYGGEEIVLLAPNTDIQTGLVLAERLRLGVCSEPYVMGNTTAVVSISIGISGTELGEFGSFEQLLESSDRALYGAKNAGKNCVYEFTKQLS